MRGAEEFFSRGRKLACRLEGDGGIHAENIDKEKIIDGCDLCFRKF